MGKQEQDYKAPLSGGMEDSKAYRRFVASSSADKTDNKAVWSNEMNDAFAALKKHESSGIVEREEPLPKVAGVIGAVSNVILTIGVVLLFVNLLACYVAGIVPGVFFTGSVVILVFGIVMYAGFRIYRAVYSRNAWIARMQARDAERSHKTAE